MNREEYMSRLASLLQDVPAEERVAAMEYYNDYFDDAGQDKEEEVIQELGSPEEVAAEMKSGLEEKKEESSPNLPGQSRQVSGQEKPWTNSWVKWGLIALVVLVAAPIVLPLILGIAAVVFGLFVALIAVLAALVVTAISVVITGVVFLFKGLALCLSDTALAFFLMGSGLLAAVLGIVAVVVLVRIARIVVPGVFRFVIELCRKPFHRKNRGRGNV